jgi:hypothetical protein
MKISFDEMRALIENYSRNVAEYEKIATKLRANGYYTRITANYEINGGGSGSGFSSKVENKVIEKTILQEKAATLAEKIFIVLKAEKVLNKQEIEIVEFLKLGDLYKMSHIARILRKNKSYVFNNRNKAIIKMCEFMERG